jgi:isoleucyl-tRNA synthetase
MKPLYPGLEKEVLSYWESDNTFQRSVENRRGRQPFVIYEGPPTANGVPGIHHVLTRTFKDAIARFRTMQGYYVERKAGWDEHGLPVEIEVQKQLEVHTKDKIEKLGVSVFNKKCAASTGQYVKDWETLTHRMGYWLDFKNAYHTSDPKYIKRVWNILGELHKRGLIYQSKKIVHWACDSGTVVSNAEAAQGYRKVNHLALSVLFPLKDSKASMLAWTTTPWTLPANMALAVNPELVYYRCQMSGKEFYTANSNGAFVIDSVKGSDLIGKEYTHPFTGETCKVLGAHFVGEKGTGIVHIAPAFGADDYALWQEQMSGVPIKCHVSPDGRLTTPNWLKGVNLLANNFEEVNAKITEYLLKKDILWNPSYLEHEYPHNWRTGKPLIFYLRPSWYVDVSKLKLLEVNDKVNWYPENVKEGRFGDWLRGGVDWAISRERYWGTPLPFYGNEVKVPPDVHKPEADEPVDGVKRTPEVLDCWFDSGAMPFAAFDEYKQADVVCEAVDQTRGWFYSLLVIGAALKGEAPYKNVVCLGHILDKNGHKMAKSKGNSVDPWTMFDRYGADAVRWWMASNTVGHSLTFTEDVLKKVIQTFTNRLWNCYSFYQTYAKIENPTLRCGNLKPIDKWLEVRLQDTINLCVAAYEKYALSDVVATINKFIDDLSNVWIRSNRNRFWNTDDDQTDQEAFYLLYTCLTDVCKLIAPIAPFMSEYIWGKINDGSVHLQDFPKPQRISDDDLWLMAEMGSALEVLAVGHAKRDEAGIKVRQPLRVLYVPKMYNFPHFENLVKEELNVKEIVKCDQDIHLNVYLDEELILEGIARDFVRAVQVARKKAGYEVTDRIALRYWSENTPVLHSLDRHAGDIKKKVLAAEFMLKKCTGGISENIGNTYSVTFSINKIR